MGQSEKMEQEDNRPKWLLELENRKRKPRLAHEVGAGAPCMKCNAACPGLDLHFWRKICKNCKCSRDDHDVPNDEFPQFDLLFGPSGKPNRRTIVLKVNKKQNEDEATFEWAPPDTSKELAADYMKALPEDKLPIKGSSGAALRKQQLQRQLPLHDIDHKMCDELSESERKQFEKYLENLKKYVGQGKVMKALGARPFDRSLMTPANATDMNRFSPKHDKSQPEVAHSLNLRTPSSFVQKAVYSSPSAESTNGTPERTPISSARMDSVRSPAFVNSLSENSPQGRYHRALANIRGNGEIINSSPVSHTRGSPLNLARRSQTNDASKSDHEEPFDAQAAESFSAARNTRNPAVEFASSSTVGDVNHGVSSFLGNTENPGTAEYNDDGRSNDEIVRSSAVPSSISRSSVNSEGLVTSSAPIGDSLNRKLDETSDEAIMRIQEQENSLLAEKMLNEALLPPSAINAADIIGSTLDRRELSLIREKLTSKYSAKDEPASLQGSLRSRDLPPGNERKDVGAKTRRADQLRRQGAFDKELDKNDVISSVKNPSGSAIAGQGASCNYIDDPSMPLELLRDGQNCATFDQGESNYPQNMGASGEIKAAAPGTFKDRVGNEPWRQVFRGICDNFLTKPGESSSDVLNLQDDRDIDRNTVGGAASPAASCKSLRAELSNYGPGNSNVIRSEDLNNPVFPERCRVSSGIAHNPVSVDRMTGAMEELSLSQTKTQNCQQCRELVRAGDVVVTAEKAKDSFWHPGCFVCSVCNELLADLVYFYYKGKLYCGRDLATLLEIPRCFACDELIFVREYTVAEGHNYHVKHFCCWDCDVPLAGQQYISENDRPLCLPCYQRTYAKTCRTCEGLIAADQQGVAVKNLNFHANDRCFCCETCKKSLLNGKMAIKEDRPFCSKECITKFMNERAG